MSDPRCGELAGYQAHGKNGTPQCQPCRDAKADWQRNYRSRIYLTGGLLQVDATGTRRRLQALVRNGWTFRALGDHIGVSEQAVRYWTYNPKVHRDTAARVVKVYDELWDTPGGSTRAAGHATRKGWPRPLAWDDDEIDDPAARPASETDRVRAFDDIAVQQAMRGNNVHLRPTERAEAVRRLTALGLSASEIAVRLRIEPRSVTRHRAASEKAA